MKIMDNIIRLVYYYDEEFITFSQKVKSEEKMNFL